jgi:hypothetical protein
MFDYQGAVVAQACRKEALESITPAVLRDQHRKVIEALTWKAMTDEEGIAWTGLSPSSYRPRRGELVEMGLVKETGEKSRTASGRMAAVWTVVR